jgi:hypothetical protein
LLESGLVMGGRARGGGEKMPVSLIHGLINGGVC